MSEHVELSILMPCLNESLTLRACVEEALETLRAAGIAGEVIVADNGSTDGSQELARSLGARVIDVPEKGYGSALTGGIAAARGKYVVMGDSDQSYDFSDAPRILTELRKGNDLVMGNRFRGGIQPGAMPWKNRHIGNPTLSGLGKLFFGAQVGDFHCGLRGFSIEAWKRMGLSTTGMEFASEMVIKAILMKMKIVEVPVKLRPDGRDRPPHLRPWRDGWRHLRFMLLYSPRWLFLYPGFFLMLIGLLVGGVLMLGPLHVGKVVFDVNTLLFAAVAVMIGFQSVAFSVCAKIFAMTSELLPQDPRFTGLFKHINLESGLVVGGSLVAIGVGLSLYAVGFWGARNFGELDVSQVQRAIIPGMLFLTLGCELILVSFFISLMGLKTKVRHAL